MHIPAGEGFEFTCNFTNPNDAEVTWGFTAEELQVMRDDGAIR